MQRRNSSQFHPGAPSFSNATDSSLSGDDCEEASRRRAYHRSLLASHCHGTLLAAYYYSGATVHTHRIIDIKLIWSAASARKDMHVESETHSRRAAEHPPAPHRGVSTHDQRGELPYIPRHVDLAPVQRVLGHGLEVPVDVRAERASEVQLGTIKEYQMRDLSTQAIESLGLFRIMFSSLNGIF